MLLAIVDPTDDGQYGVHERTVVHAVLTVEVGGQWVLLMEQSERVNHLVVVAKQTIDAASLLVVDPLEALFRHHAVFFHQSLVNVELLDTVLSRVLESLRACHAVGLHGISNAEGGIHADAVVAIELLRVHAAHRCAEDEGWLFFVTEVVQQLHGLGRVDGQVRSHDAGLGEYLAQSAYCARLSTGSESVDIENGFSCKKIRKLLDVLLFHIRLQN